MRSPAEHRLARLRLEAVLRGVAVAALAAALLISLWRALRPAPEEAPIVARFDGAPSPDVRDSLAAVQRAGHRVQWSGSVGAVAAAVEPLREPGGRWLVSVVADSATALADSLGTLDSLPTGAGTLRTDALRGRLQAVTTAATATLTPPGAVSLRRVLVLGRAGWESRFVVAALEEAGWVVDARLTLGRDRDVRQGTATPDASRHAAIVVLDTASLRRESTAVLRALRSGTGVLLAGEAALAPVPAMRTVTGATVSGREDPHARSFEGVEPQDALTLLALAARSPDAAVIERRDDTPAVVARRVGAGRVIQVGYTDTWRWRMLGEGRAPAEHRAFWSRLVGLAAAAEIAMPMTDPLAPADPAPRAALVQALGEPNADAPTGSTRAPRLPAWLGLLLLAALLGEWASRRARGAP